MHAINDPKPDRVVKMGVSLPPDLAAVVRQRAGRERRTMSNMIRVMLEESLGDGGAVAEKPGTAYRTKREVKHG